MEGKCVYGETLGRAAKERDYKAVRLQGIYYNALFQDNQSLIDFVNSQPLTNPLVCLGDGLSGHLELGGKVGHP